MSSSDLVHSVGLESWLVNLVKEFRSALEKVPKEIDRRLFNLIDLSAPCQIIALWWKEPEREHIFVFHDPRSQDLTINAVGPSSIDEMKQSMQKLLQLNYLNMKLSDDEVRAYGPEYRTMTYSQVLEDQFVWWAKQAENLEERGVDEIEGEPHVGAQMRCPGGFMWLALGNITQVNPSVLATQLISSAVKDAERDQGRPQLEIKKTENEIYIRGFAGRFPSRLWFGKKPQLTFEDKVRGQVVPGLLHFQDTYKQKIVVFEQMSFVFIEGEDKEECLRYVNEIAGALLLSGIGSFEFTKESIGQTSYQLKKFGETKLYGLPSDSLTMEQRRFFGLDPALELDVLQSYRELPKEKLLPILRSAERSINEIGKSDHLVNLLHAYTELSMANWKEAFLDSWLVIESCCRTWTLARKMPYSEAYEKSKHSANRRSPEYAFGELALHNLIAKRSARIFSEFYEIRNQVMHPPFRIPDQNEAMNCFKEAKDLVLKELQWHIK